jgi:hypothetical protein
MIFDPFLWLTDVGILAGLWILGILAVRAILPVSRLLEQLSLGFGLGIGILTWLLFLISWTGLSLNSATILFTYFFLLTFFIVIIQKANRGKHLSSVSNPEHAYGLQGIPDIIGWFFFVTFGAFLFLLSIGLSYYFWDAMAIWSVKGYGMGAEQSIFGALEWGAKGLAYPLNIPLAINIFFLADHDMLPGSKLLFPGYFIAMLIGLRVLFYRQRLPAWFAWCAVFAIGTIPLLLQYSLIGYANIPYAYYYAIGIIWVGLGLHEKDSQRVLLGAILLALSIWTRLEGLEFWPIAIISVAVVWKKELLEKKTILRVFIPAMVVGGSWMIFGRIYRASTGETALLSDALSRLAHGELQPIAVYQILRFTGYLVVKTRVYGILVPVMIGLALATVLFHPEVRKDKIPMTLLVSGIFTGIGVMFMYYLTSYDQSADLLSWLGTGYDRMLFTPLVLLAAASALIIWKTWFKKTDAESK